MYDHNNDMLSHEFLKQFFNNIINDVLASFGSEALLINDEEESITALTPEYKIHKEINKETLGSGLHIRGFN